MWPAKAPSRAREHWSATPHGEHWPTGAGIYLEFARAFSDANPGLAWGVELDARPHETVPSMQWHRLTIEGFGSREFIGLARRVGPYELASIWPRLAWVLVEASVALAFVQLAAGAPQVEVVEAPAHVAIAAPHRAPASPRKPASGGQVQYKLRGRWSREENGLSTRAYGYSLMRGEVRKLPEGGYAWGLYFGDHGYRGDRELTRAEACRACDVAADYDVAPKWIDSGRTTVQRSHGFTATVHENYEWEVSRGEVLKRGESPSVRDAIDACDDALHEARKADDAARMHEVDSATLLLARGSGGEWAQIIERAEVES